MDYMLRKWNIQKKKKLYNRVSWYNFILWRYDLANTQQPREVKYTIYWTKNLLLLWIITRIKLIITCIFISNRYGLLLTDLQSILSINNIGCKNYASKIHTYWTYFSLLRLRLHWSSTALSITKRTMFLTRQKKISYEQYII